jgi:puromycin-sensitive aminopeptidase
VLRYRDQAGVREHRELLRGEEAVIAPPARGGIGWVLANAGARGFYRVSYDAPLLRRLIEALPELQSEERMNLVSDQWALVRAGAAKVDGFLRLLEGVARHESDHSVLDEVVSRLSWIEHRGVSDADRAALQSWIGRLFSAAASELSWDAAPGEDDERRLRRAAVTRALALVARDPAAIAQAEERYRRLVAHDSRAIDPNLLDVVVAAAARGADRSRFEELRTLAEEEIDPAAKRRYLHALAMVENPALIAESVELSLGDVVRMQDFATYMGTLLANRAARELAWNLVQERWSEVRKKADSPMLLRRLIEALGALPDRAHLGAVEAFLAAHPVVGAKQAIAQTLERLRMDVALRERLMPEVGTFLRQ